MATLRPGRVDPVPGCDYETYFGTGLYEARYPAPNVATLEAALALARRGRRPLVLDFGCGSGRYAAALLERTDADVIAYDISAAALALLTERLGRHVREGRLIPVGGPLDALEEAVRARGGAVDAAMLLFGVLGHTPGRAARVALLARLAALMAPDARLLASVPNRLRRFRAERARCRGLVGVPGGGPGGLALEEGDVLYTRSAAGGDGPEIRMFYHLYTRDELGGELAEAGLRLLGLAPESVLPEARVVRDRRLARLDGLLRRSAPLGLAYGFLGLAELAAGAARPAGAGAAVPGRA